MRAIAVLSVVIYHAFPNCLSGGFIGVDIFFVISGFLISTIIIGSLESNSFKFIEFYTRRIKRIFPALLLVLIGSFVFGWFALFTDEYEQLGKHIAGSAAFIANFIFLNEVSYFDNAAETKPLLHLWSLGIEEQFYIIWPLLLWLAWKARFNLLAITIAGAVISFALNISKVQINGPAAFYLPQTRFWELLIGAVLAYMTLHGQSIFSRFKHNPDMWLGQVGEAQKAETNGWVLKNVKSLLGVILILTGLLLITRDRHFPGWWALLPTVGTVLIISAGSHAWFNRKVLSSRALVWFGLISFPLYLWHWPLLSFAQIVESGTPPPQTRIVCVLVSIVLAWLTYKFIEKPFRFGRYRKAAVIALLTSMIVVAFIGYVAYENNGLRLRAAAQLEPINAGDIGSVEFNQYANQNLYPCTATEKSKQVASFILPCVQSKSGEEKTIAVIGDSHAQPLYVGLVEGFADTNIGYYWTFNLPYISDSRNKNIFKRVIDDPNIKVVILSAYWRARLGNTPDLIDFEGRLVETVNALTSAKKAVYIADDVPNFSFHPRKCKYSRKFSRGYSCIEDRKYFFDQHTTYFPTLRLVVKDNPNVKLLETADYFCDESVCKMADKGTLFYRDDNHLNLSGSRYLGKRLIEDNSFLVR